MTRTGGWPVSREPEHSAAWAALGCLPPRCVSTRGLTHTRASGTGRSPVHRGRPGAESGGGIQDPRGGAVVHPSHSVQSPCRPRALRTLPDPEEVSPLGLRHPSTWPAPHCTPGRVLAPRSLSRELDVGLCPPFEKRFSHGRFHEQRQRGPQPSARLRRLSPARPGPLQNGPPSVLHPAPWAEGRGVAAPGADEGASEAGGGHTGLRDRGPLTERQDGASRGAGWRVLLSGGGGKPGAFRAEAGTRWGTVAPGS